ncbi:MerR family transcriptional regulator [Cognatilysobacter bugurensis]|uniref:MerR family transcriptional regulator n=1 Tax=Cognatilysobacter bugurensis TaxID=543356 RepID=A0A918W7Y3_9GAMM|nr:MerR family transcriptional regulator [Lysobacter bugurensis]GHA83349.1 MerR family transcriptional regulator [Lysobacter bugurensis]
MGELTIAGLARTGGVGVETVRYYQRRGLLAVPARGAGRAPATRRYGEDDVRRLRFIRAAQAAGFTLEQIDALMQLDRAEDRAPAHALAVERIAALDAKIAELTRARDGLQRLARRCTGEGAGPCPILSAFEPESSAPP